MITTPEYRKKMRYACNLLDEPAPGEMTKLLDDLDEVLAELSMRKSEVAVLRKAVVYGRQELSIPETDKEKRCAEILEVGRKESQDIIEKHFMSKKGAILTPAEEVKSE